MDLNRITNMALTVKLEAERLEVAVMHHRPAIVIAGRLEVIRQGVELLRGYVEESIQAMDQEMAAKEMASKQEASDG